MTLIGAGLYLIFRLVMEVEDFGTGVRKFFSGCAQMVLGIGMSLGVFLPMAANIMNSSRVSTGSGGILSLLKKCFKPYDFDYYNSLLIRPFSTNLQNLQVLGDTKYEGYKNYYEDPVLFCSALAVIFLVQFVLVFWKSNAKKRVKGAVYGAVMVKPALKETLKSFDASEYGGAPLLGLKGLVVKSHGSAKSVEIRHAIFQCEQFKEEKINEKIEEFIAAEQKAQAEEKSEKK